MSHEAEIEMLRADLALARAQIRAMRIAPAGGLSAWLDAVADRDVRGNDRDRRWEAVVGATIYVIHLDWAGWSVSDDNENGVRASLPENLMFVLLRHLGVGGAA